MENSLVKLTTEYGRLEDVDPKLQQHLSDPKHVARTWDWKDKDTEELTMEDTAMHPIEYAYWTKVEEHPIE